MQPAMIAVNLCTCLIVAHSLLKQRNKLLHCLNRKASVFAK